MGPRAPTMGYGWVVLLFVLREHERRANNQPLDYQAREWA